MSKLQWIFDEPSVKLERLSAPKATVLGKVKMTATFRALYEVGDSTLVKVEGLLPGITTAADAAQAEKLDEDEPDWSGTYHGSVAVRERIEIVGMDQSEEATGEEARAAASLKKISARVSRQKTLVDLMLEFELTDAQVASLVHMLRHGRAKIASDQVEMFGGDLRVVGGAA